MLEELLLAVKLNSHSFNDAIMIYGSYLLAQSVVYFVFHQVRRREKGEGEKSSGLWIFAYINHRTLHHIRDILLVYVCRAAVKVNC